MCVLLSRAQLKYLSKTLFVMMSTETLNSSEKFKSREKSTLTKCPCQAWSLLLCYPKALSLSQTEWRF